jgi:hypothetical protein
MPQTLSEIRWLESRLKDIGSALSNWPGNRIVAAFESILFGNFLPKSMIKSLIHFEAVRIQQLVDLEMSFRKPSSSRVKAVVMAGGRE